MDDWFRASFFAAMAVAITAGFAGAAERTAASPTGAASPYAGVFAGTVSLQFADDVLSAFDLVLIPQGHVETAFDGFTFEVDPSSTFLIECGGGRFRGFSGGAIQTCGAMLLDRPGERVVVGNLIVEEHAQGILAVKSTLDGRRDPLTLFTVGSSFVDFGAAEGELRIMGELTLAAEFAETLDQPSAAGVVLGQFLLDAQTDKSVHAELGTAACHAGLGENVGFGAVASVGPDVIVADLQEVTQYDPAINDITAFAIGTFACNVGTERVNWVAHTNQHPVIVQNMYRLKEDRFEQIGMARVKHGFYALSGSLCGTCNDPTDGSQLGVGCSDPYSASLNGIQSNMNGRQIVNAHTGYFPYEGASPPADTTIDRRLQVHNSDLDPELNVGARYFVEGHYITPDDCRAGTQDNNATYREVRIIESSNRYFLALIPGRVAQRGQAGVRAWQDADDEVMETDIRVPGEGLFILAAKVRALGGSRWRYTYALQNLNSDRSARSFSIDLPYASTVENIGFHDVDYHSGDPYELTDWQSGVVDKRVTWSTDLPGVNPRANALRYDTVYTFWFDADGPPGDSGLVRIELFKPGAPTGVTALTLAPESSLRDCNRNGVPDTCDIDCGVAECQPPCGVSADCNENEIPDECESDCNENQRPDDCDIAQCPPGDSSCADCNENRVPDGCEADCNNNEIADDCDIRDCAPKDLSCADCNANGVPDGCEADCDEDGLPDDCDPPTDTDQDGVIDCVDRCPVTTPPQSCVPPEFVVCRWGVLNHICLYDYPRNGCLESGGRPNCDPLGGCANAPCLELMCRDGCLFGDEDGNGDLDLWDYAVLQRCFNETSQECMDVFDFDQDENVKLDDYSWFCDAYIIR